MLHRSFKPAKCKTSLKLATSRIKLMKNKKGVQINQMKRELSQLLETGQERTARIRVEHVIREEKMVAAYELIEIYCELIAARLPIIESQKNCPIDLKEAVTSVIFASPRCSDISELQDVRKHFTAKYGKEFISAAIELRPDCGVGRMLIEKLSAVAPDVQTKIKVLTAVAEEYNIKWDPTSFEEKESKPPNDLLNGPNTFEKAGMMHADPPKFPAAPSAQVPHYHEQRRDEPANFSQQNSRSSHGTQYFDPTDTSGNQTSYADSRPSGRGAERPEFRQSFSQHGDDSSSGRQNWNMEFKDATAAAQAAAESAERASMAARAAAELSRQANNSVQHSTDSHNSNFTEEGPRRYGEQYSRNSVNNSFSERKPQVQNQQRNISDHASSEKAADRFYEDDNPNNKRSSRVASFQSRKDSIDDASSVNTLNKANPSQGSVKVENSTVSPEMSVRGQSRREPEGDLGKSQQDGFKSYREEMPENRSSTSSSRSHSINFDDEDVVPRPDSWKFGNDIVEDPPAKSDHRNRNKETPETSTYDDGSDGVAFDEADSDDDGPTFDMGPSFDETDANSFFPSPGRESPIHSLEHTNSWSSRSTRKSVEKSSLQTQNFSERQTSPDSPEFSEYSADPIYPSEPDNQVPTVYNPSNRPDFDNDDEHRTRQSRTSYYDLDQSQLNDRSDVKSPKISNSGKSRFELTDLLEAESSLPSPVEEEKSLQSQHSTRLSHGGELEDDVQTTVSSYSESGQELNFGPLIGGLRNKGYVRPLYTRNPSGEASSLPQKLPEVGPAYVEQISTPVVKSSLNSVARRMEPKESNIPHTSSASDSNSSEMTPEYSRKTREDITKSRFEPPAGFLYHEDDDSEDDIPQQSTSSRVQLGAGLSRRTKATPTSETRNSSKVRVGPDGKTINSTNDTVRKHTRHSYSDQTPTEHRANSGSFKQETSKTMNESRPARHEENLKSHAAENPSNSLKKRVESGENARASSFGGGSSTGESPPQKASHVHPKLPDYDDIAARLQALRMNR